MRNLLSLALVISLVVTGCSSSGRVVVKSDPRPPAPPEEPGTPPVTEPGSPPEVTPPLPYGNQGPVASVGVPPGHYPPAGQCRVWLPGTPPGHQPAPQVCEDAARDVPPGGWLVRSPKGGLVEVLAYDEHDADVVVMISWYDAKSGDLVAADDLASVPSAKGKGNGKDKSKGKAKGHDK